MVTFSWFHGFYGLTYKRAALWISNSQMWCGFSSVAYALFFLRQEKLSPGSKATFGGSRSALLAQGGLIGNGKIFHLGPRGCHTIFSQELRRQ